jgi:hypothetical protein
VDHESAAGWIRERVPLKKNAPVARSCRQTFRLRAKLISCHNRLALSPHAWTSCGSSAIGSNSFAKTGDRRPS